MYEAYYRFKAKPFQLNGDRSFFFASHGQPRVMAFLAA